MEKLRKILSVLSDILYPRRCALCDCALKVEEPYICVKCAPKVSFIKDRTCVRCGRVMKSRFEEICLECLNDRQDFDEAFAPFVYDGDIRKSLMRFKYGGRAEYAAFYAEAVYHYGTERFKRWSADAIIPVPVHRSRLAVRGYNQAELFADELSKRIGVPVRTDIVDRIKRTEAQKELNAAQRRENLKSAFTCRTFDVPKTVIIADDIFTTGSTVNAVSRALRESGAERVYAVCVSIG